MACRHYDRLVRLSPCEGVVRRPPVALDFGVFPFGAWIADRYAITAETPGGSKDLPQPAALGNHGRRYDLDGVARLTPKDFAPRVDGIPLLPTLSLQLGRIAAGLDQQDASMVFAGVIPPPAPAPTLMDWDAPGPVAAPGDPEDLP